MRLMLEDDLAPCKTLDEVFERTVATLTELRDKDGYELRYVAGPISCDGDAKIPENLAKLKAERSQLMRTLGKSVLVFTAPFIFTAENYRKLGLFELNKEEREGQLQGFWDRLILSGLISAIHMAPGWERSPGATRERETALVSGVQVHYI